MMHVREIRGADPNYVIKRFLGRGAFGSVYEAIRKWDDLV
jgi:serine/threonine protein kinase